MACYVKKDCINGFIGAFQKDGSNAVVDWVGKKPGSDRFGSRDLYGHMCDGFCSDSSIRKKPWDVARVERHFGYDKGCSTYDLPRQTAESLGIPISASHPQNVTHYMGLYFMASRGASLVNEVTA